MYICLFIYICICILGIIKRRNIFVYIALVTLCILLCGLNYDNPDYIAYENRYNWASYPTEFNIISVLDISFTFLQVFCKDIGIASYQDFRLILSGLIYIYLAIVVSKYCIYRNLFFAIYIFAYLPLDIVQIRNFFAFVVLMPFLLLLNHPSSKNLLKYFVGLLIAFTIHFSSIIFSIFGFIGIKNKRTKIVLIVCIAVSVIVMYPFIRFVMNSSAAVDRVDGYFQPSIFGALLLSSYLLLNYVMILLLPQIPNSITTFIKSRFNLNVSVITYSFINKINFLLLFLIPLVFMNGSVLRLFRFISIINIIYILNILYYSRKNKGLLYLAVGIYTLFFAFVFSYSKTEVIEAISMNYLFL